MRRMAQLGALAAALVVVGCKEILGVKSHDVVAVTVFLPTTIYVGDTAQARALGKDARGIVRDSVATWSSSNAAAVAVDATGRVTGSVAGRSATIFAEIAGKTGSATVAIADDPRIGYALADQPSATGPYAPDANYLFNSSGGAITIARASAGVYAVRFAGLGRGNSGRDNVQVTSDGPTPGVFCKLGGWQSPGTDLTADVLCFTPRGAPADSRFSILLSGAHVYNPTARLGFALSPDFGGANTAAELDSSVTARNDAPNGHIDIGRTGLGQYAVQFPGLERVPGSGADNAEVTAVGSGPERCRVTAINAAAAGLAVMCTTTDGMAADSRFSILWISKGRARRRWGYAYANQPGATADYAPDPHFARNPGGDITARQIATGRYRVVFQGLARAPGDRENVVLTPVGTDGMCSTESWGNINVTDLVVTLSCFNISGAFANTAFDILVVQ